MKRFAAAIFAAILATLGIVAISVSPASADPVLNCMPQLTTCGYPTVATTGPTGSLTLCTTLTSPACDAQGNLNTTSDNQVIEDMEIEGCIVVDETNVTIDNVFVHGDCAFYIEVTASGASATISNTEVKCDGSGTGIGNNENTTLVITTSHIHRCDNGLNFVENASVSDSIIEAYESTEEQHGDLIQGWAGSNVVIDHNLLIAYNPMNAAITAPNDAEDWAITDNLLGGGGYTIFCPPGTPVDWVITGNRFLPKGEDAATRETNRLSAVFHYSTDCDEMGVTWSGNFNDMDGASISAF